MKIRFCQTDFDAFGHVHNIERLLCVIILIQRPHKVTIPSEKGQK
jgi:hypothetical protein